MNFSPDRLRGHRHGRGMDRDDLSVHSGVPLADIEDYEADRSTPGTEALDRMALALGVSVVDLCNAGEPEPMHDYISAALSHVRQLSPEEADAAASTLRSIREAGR